jgi:hypothetical protein
MLELKDIYLAERKVLSVFDFDDTIAKSDAWVYVTRAGRVTKKLNPAEFAVYKPKPGEDFDFKDFDRPLRNPRLIKLNADLLRRQIDKAKRAARGTRKVTILTARRLGAPVTSFLKTMGIDAYVVPIGSADPKLKADWIEQQIKKGYDTVYFMDDSNKNIQAVKNMLRQYPNVQSITKLIKESVLSTSKINFSNIKSSKINAILSEGISKNAIKDIIDRVYPSIVNDLGKSRYGNKVPTIELHVDIYARLSGIPGSTGEESKSSEAQYDDEENKIFIYYPNMKDEKHVIQSLLHEYTHSLQDPEKWAEARKDGYENNPFEKEATRAEKNWKKYI